MNWTAVHVSTPYNQGIVEEEVTTEVISLINQFLLNQVI